MLHTAMVSNTSIRTYRAKRNFPVASAPAPHIGGEAPDAPIFVVQKHQAHRAGLHWDFRLEHDGVLWSWAVRKGPSLDPADKRIAVHVEDHPLDYADFQGTIPDGQYGAGKVETWDRGTWEALDDPAAGMRKGEIKFVLHGKRLNGRFTLVRLKPRPDQRSRQDNWLLIKGHDEAERAGADATAIELEVAAPKLKRDWCEATQAAQLGARGGRRAGEAAAAPGAATRLAGGGTAGRRRLGQRNQVRRLSPAVLDRPWNGARDDAEWAGLDGPAAGGGA